jgi:hypothetical protein
MRSRHHQDCHHGLRRMIDFLRGMIKFEHSSHSPVAASSMLCNEQRIGGRPIRRSSTDACRDGQSPPVQLASQAVCGAASGQCRGGCSESCRWSWRDCERQARIQPMM